MNYSGLLYYPLMRSRSGLMLAHSVFNANNASKDDLSKRPLGLLQSQHSWKTQLTQKGWEVGT
ncbi:MAG: hypothetical protein F6K51_35805 [Moorea sp. SIO3I8]|nr:hypothetical protein [Moorena sp. SIO3I8]